jgi:flagellar biosynthesis regulator FlaF
VSWGDGVDYETHSWMLDQVDFLVETIGDESLQLSDEMRSNLLQFLLTIANLNEEIRHKAALGL